MYNFIHCEQQLKQFCQQILPPLEKDEVIVLFLKARKKYASELSSDKLLQRRVIKNYKLFMPKLKQFNCQIGSYQDNDEKNIPQNACVIYCTVNPCSTLTATKNLISLYSEYLFNLVKKPDQWSNILRIYSTTANKIQSSRARKYYIDIDFDVVDKTLGKKYVQRFLDVISEVHHHIIETRGGYHILLLRSSLTPEIGRKMHQKTHILDSEGKKELGDKFEVIINPETTIPVPGTKQGGFAVRIIDSLDK
ncbi:hypothetical protein [Candidatus Uabimicrobium sp. HlEnr_7]|uniref:hypothetical protein n=1 Tax=Candidatus Uabimicrobium helgolandensis TaxID=3095367 RepID=UPI003558AE9A